jgi:NADPH2:quinone reductase
MLPENYRAWIWHGENLPSGLRLETLPLPHPNIGQVLVRNEAIGLNPVDWKLLNIKIGEIPGVDGAGTIVSVGPGVTSHWIGQRVAWHQSLQKSGSFAEYTLLDVNIMLRIPPKVDSIVAAALPCPGLTAWQALEKIPYRSGDHLLISGAGGSVGHYLLQLACQRGFVVDTLSHPRHHTKLSALGASHCYATPGNAASWAAQTQYNAIIDASSPDSHSWLCRALAANGHFVAILGRPENSYLFSP